MKLSATFAANRPLAIRAVVACVIALVFATAWTSTERHVFRVLGQPTATGFIQSGVEAPFFRNLAEAAGLPVEFKYRPLDQDIAREESGLEALKNGIYDIVSLRFQQLGHVEPVIAGIDIPGMTTDYALARAMTARYAPQIDKALQQRWDSRLLALWPFGPQVILCVRPLRGLADLRGRRMRVPGPTIQALVLALGGIPLPMSYAETRRALQSGAVDCASSSLASARAAGWFDEAKNVLLLPVQFGINGYAISNAAWKKLDASEQVALVRAFDGHAQAIWATSEKLHSEIVRCATGEDPCVDRMRLKIALPGGEDRDFLKNHTLGNGLDAWVKTAGACPSCRDDWLRAVGRFLDTSGGPGAPR